MLRKLAVVTVACATLFTQSVLALPRVNATQKGSVLVYPKVEVRYHRVSGSWKISQDTFIQLSNDNTLAGVHITAYYVGENLNPPGEDPNCPPLYFDFTLTHQQAAYWSAGTGQGTVNVPPVSTNRAPYPDPEDPNNANVRVWRGFLVVIATNTGGTQQINWNHLLGLGTLVNYRDGWSWEYHPYAFQALQGDANGGPVGTAGTILLNGVQYERSFNRLLLTFFGVGSLAFSNALAAPPTVIIHDTDLTLLINDIDVRQERGFCRTKAKFSIFNEDENSLSTEFCMDCWDQTRLSVRGGIFLVENLQTDMAFAQINGEESPAVCEDSKAYALLGAQAKLLYFIQAADRSFLVTAGGELQGSGEESATIKFDIPGGPESLTNPGGKIGGTGMTAPTRR